jgi:hypothetical protein
LIRNESQTALLVPKRNDDVCSKTLCLALCLIIERKAARNVGDGDLIDEIHHMLAVFGILQDQFYEVEKESGDLLG